MYYIYRKSAQGNQTRYVQLSEAHLFGCNEGLIPRFLRTQLPPKQSPQFRWHLSFPDKLHESGQPGTTLIIDVKPRNKKPSYVSLYELLDVWGFSDRGWTPVLLRMRGLVVDESPDACDKLDFAVEVPDDNKAIFSILHLSGSVENGATVGKWLPPGASPTNSTLLWPEVFDYFYECKQVTMNKVRHHGT